MTATCSGTALTAQSRCSRGGIEVVPALVGEYAPADEVHVPGGLPREAIFGRRPPLLPDYLDDALSAAVEAPRRRAA